MGGRHAAELALALHLKLDNLQVLFAEARRIAGIDAFVVVGSLSILGVLQAERLPRAMLVSIDVDAFSYSAPERIFELADALGETSAFAARHGYYLDPVSDKLPTLPEGWRARLVRVPLDDGLTIYFLDPNDAAVSKYARSSPRDREWARAGLAAGLLSAPIIESRFTSTDFLDDAEARRARAALAEDRARE